MRKKLDIILVAVFVLIAAFAAWKLVSILLVYKQEADYYRDLGDQFVTNRSENPNPTLPEETIPYEVTTADDPTPVPIPTTALQPPIEVDFYVLKEMNPEIIGWVYVEGTVINYPILQTTDNITYLYKKADGKETGGGAVFLDCGSEPDFTGDNSILYGHHMKDGSMFAILSRFKDRKFFEEHPEGWILTPGGSYHVVFYASHVVDATDWAFTVNLPERADKEDYIRHTLTNPFVTGERLPDINDRIIMFSTCSYEYDDARAALYGILERCE